MTKTSEFLSCAGLVSGSNVGGGVSLSNSSKFRIFLILCFITIGLFDGGGGGGDGFGGVELANRLANGPAGSDSEIVTV